MAYSLIPAAYKPQMDFNTWLGVWGALSIVSLFAPKFRLWWLGSTLLTGGFISNSKVLALKFLPFAQGIWGLIFLAPLFYKFYQAWKFNRLPAKAVLAKVDKLNKLSSYDKGYQFEEIVAQVFRSLGYDAMTTTELRAKGKLPPSIQKRGGSGEQGVDVIARKNGKIYAIQCKHYSQTVGNSAVQEITAALNLYGAHQGIVVTNKTFTKPAQELALHNDVILIDRYELERLINSQGKKAA